MLRDDNGLEPRTRPASHRPGPRSMATVLDETPMPAQSVEAADTDDDELAELHRMQLERIGRRREQAGIPPRWHGARFAEMEGNERREAIEAATSWALGHGIRALLLHGPVGTGKSRIAATALWERAMYGPVRWLNAADVLMQLSLGFDSPDRERAARALRPDVNVALVLDDLDKIRATDHAIQPFYLAVNAWIEHEQAIIVTLNHDLDGLAEDFGDRFGEAIASRLAGYCHVSEVPGEDRRLEV